MLVDRGNSAPAPSDLKARWTTGFNGEKLSVRGLFGIGDDASEDVKIAKSSVKSNAQACSDAINKLRKAKARKARKARKRSDVDDLDMEDEPSDDGMDLGTESFTVPMGGSAFQAYDNDDDIEILGTVGLNSCSGVLIVGKKGATIAHLDPIEADGNADQFNADVASKVTQVYNDNKDNLEDAKMYVKTSHLYDLDVDHSYRYIAVPNGDHGEKDILEKAASDLGIDKDTTTYDVVDNDDVDEDYMSSGKGTIYVNFKDNDSPKVAVFGEEK